MHVHDVDQPTPEIKPRRKRRTAQTHPWYKRYPRDFWDGVDGLELDEVGAYTLLIDWMYELDGPIPNDDSRIAHRLRVHGNKWRRIRSRLFELQKLFLTNRGICNHRVEEVLADRAALKSGGVSPPVTPPDTTPDLFENVILFNAPRQQSQSQSQKVTPIEGQRVSFDNGKIELYGGLREMWLKEFGDEKTLALALLQAAGYVEPKGSRPLEAKVSAQLAKQMQWKRERQAKAAKVTKFPGQRPIRSELPPSEQDRLDRIAMGEERWAQWQAIRAAKAAG